MESKEDVENMLKKLPILEMNLKQIDSKITRLISHRKDVYKKIKRFKKIKERYDKANQTI